MVCPGHRHSPGSVDTRSSDWCTGHLGPARGSAPRPPSSPPTVRPRVDTLPHPRCPQRRNRRAFPVAGGRAPSVRHPTRGGGAQRGASLACGPFPLLRWLTRRIHVTGPRAPASARTRLWRVCKVDAGTVAQLPSPGRGRASRGGGESPPRCPEAWTPEGPPQTQGGSATRHPPCTTHARWHDCLSGEPNTPPARPRTRGGVCTRGPLRPPGVVDVGPPSAPGSQIQGRNPVFGAPGPVHSLPRRQPSRRARRHVRRAALGKMFCPPGFLSPRTNRRAGSGRPGWARAGLSVPRPHTGQPRGLVSCVRLSRLHPEEGDGGCAQAARRGAPGDAAAAVAGTESETQTVCQPGRPAGVGATLTSPVTLQGLCSPTT